MPRPTRVPRLVGDNICLLHSRPLFQPSTAVARYTLMLPDYLRTLHLLRRVYNGWQPVTSEAETVDVVATW